MHETNASDIAVQDISVAEDDWFSDTAGLLKYVLL